MTVANNREYDEQVRPGEIELKKQGDKLTSQIISHGLSYAQKQQSSELEEIKEDNLQAKANRLRSLASRLTDQLSGCNNALHRGNVAISETAGKTSDASIDSILAQTESILEKAENEAIALGHYLGGL